MRSQCIAERIQNIGQTQRAAIRSETLVRGIETDENLVRKSMFAKHCDQPGLIFVAVVFKAADGIKLQEDTALCNAQIPIGIRAVDDAIEMAHDDLVCRNAVFCQDTELAVCAVAHFQGA